MKSCFFIGHHDTSTKIYPMLLAEVERHIAEHNVTEFFVGRYGSFDMLAARAVMEAKVRHPNVRLVMVLPYHPAIRNVETPDGFDGTYYPWESENVPKRFAIVRTNQRMVDTCDFLITNAWHHIGGTGNIVDHARKREMKNLIHVTNLSQRKDAI